MSKLHIFNFDGTSNEPSDADQDVKRKGSKEDDNITNILKFHLMCGGNLKDEDNPQYSKSSLNGANQNVFYYHGVGTYGSRLKRLYNAAFAIKSDVKSILRKALKDFDDVFVPGDILLVTGFSRGAALARRFVAKIEQAHQKKAVTDPNYLNMPAFVYEALYDTVASIGIPNMSKSDRPDSEVLFENGHTLPKNVIKALHCISMDDKRNAFQPTLMNYQKDVVHEVWFSGAHSDVGGGYYRDGLSDTSLEYYLNWLSDNVSELKYETPTEHMLHNILPNTVDYEIGLDDIAINANPLGKNHQQDRFFIINWLTLTDRVCAVIENDKLSDRRPLVHSAVAERIHKDDDYRPKSLRNVKHTIVFADGRTKDCQGFKPHIENPRHDLRYLKAPNGQSSEKINITVFASQLNNRTGLLLETEGIYNFTVTPKQKWKDGCVECGPQGWNRKDVELGLIEGPIALMESFRRVPKAQWFSLCGSIEGNDDYAFEIGKGINGVVIKKSGEFTPFANDISSRYGNNAGKIVVTVERMG